MYSYRKYDSTESDEQCDSVSGITESEDTEIVKSENRRSAMNGTNIEPIEWKCEYQLFCYREQMEAIGNTAPTRRRYVQFSLCNAHVLRLFVLAI